MWLVGVNSKVNVLPLDMWISGGLHSIITTGISPWWQVPHRGCPQECYFPLLRGTREEKGSEVPLYITLPWTTSLDEENAGTLTVPKHRVSAGLDGQLWWGSLVLQRAGRGGRTVPSSQICPERAPKCSSPTRSSGQADPVPECHQLS